MRTAVLVVCLCLLLAGCSSAISEQPTTTTTQDCPTTEEYESRPLPELPANVTPEAAQSYAESHAETVAWNEQSGHAGYELDVSSVGSVTNQTEDGYVIHISGTGSYKECRDGQVSFADFGLNVNYFINDTTAIRLENPANETADPREHGGEVVA